ILIGLPEFDFPPMDPLFYEYGIVMLNSGEIRGELIMSNVTVIGLSKARIFNARTQFLSHDVFRLEIDVQMPEILLKGAAKINGSLSVFRIANEGNFNITLNDVRASWEITGHVVNDTWIVEQFHITPLIGKFKIYYKDLSENNKELSICKRNSDDYSTCLKQAVEKAWPKFAAGLPEFDIPTLDPFFFKYYKFVINSDNIHGELSLSNNTVTGSSKIRIPNVRMYFFDDGFRLENDVNVPRIFSKGSIKINGNLNPFKIANEGYYNLTLEGVSGTLNYTGHVINDTWIIEHFHCVPSIRKFKLYYDDVVKEKKAFTATICKQDSVDYSACLKQAFKEAFPRFVKGLPEFDLPPVDPLFYEYGKVVFNSGDIHAEVALTNTIITGLAKIQVNDIRPHFLDDVFHLEVDALAPKLILKGVVKMNGTLGIFRIASEGPFNLTANDVDGTWDMVGHVVNDTWIIEHVRVLPSVRKLKLYFDLFQDNKEINDIVISFANEFWPPLYRVMLPITSEAWDPWLTGMVNKLFSKVSFSKVFP
ncbi:hypothetical protein ALC56_10028, partial [Trachymyrmex septentrionalis]